MWEKHLLRPTRRPTSRPRNDGVSGAKLEEIATWNLNYQDKNVVMLIGTNNLGGKLFNDATRQNRHTHLKIHHNSTSRPFEIMQNSTL